MRPGKEATHGHPIRVVAERTALTPEVLRAWERRYGAVRPERTASGQRLYSDADIERLRLLNRATSGGRSIGQVAALPTEELAALVLDDEVARVLTGEPARDPLPGAGESDLRAAMEAVRTLDSPQLDAILRRATVLLGAERFVDRVAIPLLRELGTGWAEGRLTIAHEHLASTVIRRTLGSLLEAVQRPEGAPTLVAATPPGERHEFGAMLAGASAAAVGWRVVYLGADLPSEDIAHAVRQTGARVVLLSLVNPRPDGGLIHELRALREGVPPEVQLLVGGAAAEQMVEALRGAKAVLLDSLPELRHALTGMLEAHAERNGG